MINRLIARVQGLVARVVAWQVNERYEKCALELLERTHLGASLEWVGELVESRGRHALVIAHH